MHKIIGKREDKIYFTRKGAYLIPIIDGKIAVCDTYKGFFLLGGGIDDGETDEECIKRECIEEIGYSVTVDEFIGSGESYTYTNRGGNYHPIQQYYLGELHEKICEPIEEGHNLTYVDYYEIRGKMHLDIQNWAIDEAMKQYSKKGAAI